MDHSAKLTTDVWSGLQHWWRSWPWHLFCVESKTWGAAKEATIIPVTIRLSGSFIDQLKDIFQALRQVMDQVHINVIGQGQKGKYNVINMSWGFTSRRDAVEEYYAKIIGEHLAQLVKHGAILVAAAGNSREVSHTPPVVGVGTKNMLQNTPDIDAFPQILADGRVPEMIVVGSINSSGVQSSFSQGGHLLDVAAVGEDVFCAKHELTSTSGTSFGKSNIDTM